MYAPKPIIKILHITHGRMLVVTCGGQMRLCHDRREVHDWRSNGVPAAESAGRKKRSLNLIINQSRRHVDERGRKAEKGLLINIW